ncbi:unnamed protein product [Clonostachys byssicola]|uniref:DUF6604 domain-containing protein n=1 Tax=Clonostachys byssicola TaxID=160290 RepID=A0A9N9UDP3_9HYPO|nr:unnamed protein product [Clonostachys byssicola]
MLPQALASVYREYKKDTNSIATWLASTAKVCGYPASLLPSAPGGGGTAPPAKGGRAKGKARTVAKKAKGEGQGGPGTKPQADLVRYIISIKDFVPLAECISASKIPSLCVPKAFFTTLDRVISIRSGFSKELKEHNVALDAESDAKHSHFVGVFKKVREALEQFKSAAASPTPDPVSTLSNKFELLKVYVPSDDFVNAPDIDRPKPATEQAEIFEVDPSQSLEEAIVAFYMMCTDLGEIRHALSTFWATTVSEQGSAYDPGVMAIVTNTGIEFGKNIIEEMLPIFEPHGGIRTVMNSYLSLIPVTGNQSIYDFESWDKGSESAERFYNILSKSYFLECNVLDKLAEVPWRGAPFIYPEGAFGTLNPNTDWKSKTVDQKINQDLLITTELYFEALTLVHNVPDYPFTDEFVRGVEQFKETRQIPFSLVFASQVNLDIHHAVGDYAETSIDTLLKRLTSMEAFLRSSVNFHKGVRNPHWSSRNQRCLEQSLEGFEWFLKDPMHEVRILAVRGDPKGQQIVRGIKKWRLLRRSPVMAGLALHYHRADVHEAGLLVTNQWGSIILPAHLYNAVLKEGHCQTLWPDMETLMGIFGEEQFFVGGKPDNTSAYVSRFMLQVGASASTLVNVHRRSKKIGIDDFSKAGTRFLTTRATSHGHFHDRYNNNNAKQMNWTPEYVNEILSLEKYALAIALNSEVYKLSFPYLFMHRINWGHLTAYKKVWDPILRTSFGSDYIQQEWQLPFAIGQVLALADGVDGRRDDKGLALAGLGLGATTKSNAGSVCTQQMYRLCGRDYDVS